MWRKRFRALLNRWNTFKTRGTGGGGGSHYICVWMSNFFSFHFLLPADLFRYRLPIWINTSFLPFLHSRRTGAAYILQTMADKEREGAPFPLIQHGTFPFYENPHSNFRVRCRFNQNRSDKAGMAEISMIFISFKHFLLYVFTFCFFLILKFAGIKYYYEVTESTMSFLVSVKPHLFL